MTGPTHKRYAVCFACIASMILYKYNISQINYYLVLIIILTTAKAGALFPDVDHEWCNVHDKTVVNRIINILIHITGGKHRSWQTHSIDICTYFTIAACILPNIMYNKGLISDVNKEVISIILIGFSSGWISHLFSDMLTSGGVRLICFIDYKIRLVPRKIGKLKFNTGNEWENFNFKLMKIINILLGVASLLYPLIIEDIININNLFNGG